MFFYVFIDPDVVSEAASHGEMGLGRLVEFLHGLDRDCILAETDYWRVGEEIKEKVKAIRLHHERKEIEELIIHLWKQAPFVMIEGDDGETALIDLATEHGDREELDLILTSRGDVTRENSSWEASSLARLHTTAFAQSRDNLKGGKSFTAGEVSVAKLFDVCFKKMLRHANRVIIFDYALGEYLGGSQYANFPKWIRWMGSDLRLPKDTKVVIQTVGVDGTPNFRSLRRLVDDLSNEVDFTIILETKSDKTQLPHNRYLVADSKCLDIDRGIDICDEENKCRKVAINYAARP